MPVVFSALTLLLMIGALADMITLDPERVKHLPKLVWIIIVILVPLVGGILWFALGHQYQPRTDRGSFGDPRRWAKPEPVRSQTSDYSVRDTAAELAALEREIAEDERAEKIRKLESELEAKRREKGAGA